jgi:hypothetical protein
MTRLHILVSFNLLIYFYLTLKSLTQLNWNFQAVLLVSVYGVASRPTEMTNNPATESVNDRLTFGNLNAELPGSSPLSIRFKSN